jgi:hypothetical protein
MKVTHLLTVSLGLASIGFSGTGSEAGVISRLLQRNDSRGSVVQQAVYASPVPVAQVVYSAPETSVVAAAAPAEVMSQVVYSNPVPNVQVAYSPPVGSALAASAPAQIFSPPLSPTEIEDNINRALIGSGQTIRRQPRGPSYGGSGGYPAAPSKVAPAPSAPSKSGL